MLSPKGQALFHSSRHVALLRSCLGANRFSDFFQKKLENTLKKYLESLQDKKKQNKPEPWVPLLSLGFATCSSLCQELLHLSSLCPLALANISSGLPVLGTFSLTLS